MRVLIADDDRQVCTLLAFYVRECGHEVVDTVSGGGLAAIRSFTRHEPDLVLLDIFMPQLSGTTACRQMLSRKPSTKIIFVTGMLDGLPTKIAECHAAGSLAKPFDLNDVRALLHRFAPMVPHVFQAASVAA